MRFPSLVAILGTLAGCMNMGPPVDPSVTNTSFAHTKAPVSAEEPSPVCVEWHGIVNEAGAQPPLTLSSLDECLRMNLQGARFFAVFGRPAEPQVAASPLPRLEMRARLLQFVAGGGEALFTGLEIQFELRLKGSGKRYGSYVVHGASGGQRYGAESLGFSEAAQGVLEELRYFIDQDRPRYEALR